MHEECKLQCFHMWNNTCLIPNDAIRCYHVTVYASVHAPLKSEAGPFDRGLSSTPPNPSKCTGDVRSAAKRSSAAEVLPKRPHPDPDDDEVNARDKGSWLLFTCSGSRCSWGTCLCFTLPYISWLLLFRSVWIQYLIFGWLFASFQPIIFTCHLCLQGVNASLMFVSRPLASRWRRFWRQIWQYGWNNYRGTTLGISWGGEARILVDTARSHAVKSCCPGWQSVHRQRLLRWLQVARAAILQPRNFKLNRFPNIPCYNYMVGSEHESRQEWWQGKSMQKSLPGIECDRSLCGVTESRPCFPTWFFTALWIPLAVRLQLEDAKVLQLLQIGAVSAWRA